MKHSQYLVAVVAAVLLSASAVFAGDPTGTWTWNRPGRDGQTHEASMSLTLKDGKLDGAVSGFRGGENPISEASFANDEVRFKVVVEFDGNKRVAGYDGKLVGDTITGTITYPGRDGGEAHKIEWTATRKKG